MSRRTKILIAIIILIVVVIVGYLLLKGKRATPQSPAINIPSSNVPAGVETNNTQPVTNTPTTTPFATAEATARSFAERWGSFSSESDFQNVRDLYPVMTASMKTWADGYVRDQRKAQVAGEFFGVTTRAMKTETTEDKGNTVKVLVTAQRIESKGSLAPRSYYQTMEVSLVKNGSGYLVDGAWWK